MIYFFKFYYYVIVFIGSFNILIYFLFFNFKMVKDKLVILREVI